MLDTKIITNKEAAQSAPETNAFDVMIKLIEFRQEILFKQLSTVDEEASKILNNVMHNVEIDIDDLKAIATDQYDKEEEA